MTEYLSTFANILDELFKGMSECSLLSNYTVQLQSNLSSIETLIKFKTVIEELMKNLQSLLSQIPNVQSAKVSTRTFEEIVVTCHPINIATLKKNQLLTTRMIGKGTFLKDCSNVIQRENDTTNNSQNKNENENDSSPTVSAIEICELKPLIIDANENFSQLINFQPSAELNFEKKKVENFVHIVVQAPNINSEHSIHHSKNGIEIEKLKCTECDVVLKCKDEQREHFQRLHVHSHNCDMCDKEFISVQALQEHCRRCHNSAGCFLCSTCNKRFMTKLSYNRHIDTHKGKKDAVCNLCGKAFSRADYLQTHYQTHLGKRNFACSQCPRRFVRSIHLRAHEKVHSGIKDHICNVCNKGFVRRDKLKEHVLRHLNIKRFQCPICQRDYAEKRDLKVHLKSHSK